MDNIANIVGANLASLRKAKNLTQQDLADEIHYSDKSISKWELGYSCPSIDVLMDFASYFGVPLEYLVTQHTEEELKGAIDPEPKKDPRAVNKALILAMTMMVVLLVLFTIFFSKYIMHPEDYTCWSVFPWAVPICMFFATIEVWRFYRNRVASLVLLAVFTWSFLLCFCIHYAFFTTPSQNIWVLMGVGVPIQVILILIASMRR